MSNKLFSKPAGEFAFSLPQATVLQEMPPFPEKDSLLLSKLYKTAPWMAKLHGGDDEQEEETATAAAKQPSGNNSSSILIQLSLLVIHPPLSLHSSLSLSL